VPFLIWGQLQKEGCRKSWSRLSSRELRLRAIFLLYLCSERPAGARLLLCALALADSGPRRKSEQCGEQRGARTVAAALQAAAGAQTLPYITQRSSRVRMSCAAPTAHPTYRCASPARSPGRRRQHLSSAHWQTRPPRPRASARLRCVCWGRRLSGGWHRVF
jgi:hypothetical protein